MDQWIGIDADRRTINQSNQSNRSIDPTRRRPRAVSREWIDATD
tara:strand:- start:3451 stop:3582 length:132 start_codon:yes stop_codon:yes gene_type:complete